jgi:hypothetical protein
MLPAVMAGKFTVGVPSGESQYVSSRSRPPARRVMDRPPLSIMSDFFKFEVLRGKLHGDPTLAIERARKGRCTAKRSRPSSDPRSSRSGMLASQPEPRDRVALRLLLDYGLRKGALQQVQFKPFDHLR